MILKFTKDPDNTWFVDLPEWKGPRSALQMVMGADTFLDILAQGANEVAMKVNLEYFEGASILVMTSLGELDGPEEGTGAWYRIDNYDGVNYCLDMWLCDVTKFVFSYFPDMIYFYKQADLV